MTNLTRYLLSLCFFIFLFTNFSLWAQPGGFVNTLVSSQILRPVGLTFDGNGQMYVWEKRGRVFVFQNGVKVSTPLIDIREEVANHSDQGLTGFALDPNFLTNGYYYLLYTVDRHHLMNYGTPAYGANTNEYFQATIARITRYTADPSTNFTTTLPNSRLVLVGTSLSDGLPVMDITHGPSILRFGTDGSLIAANGDGFFNPANNWQIQAYNDGIITAHDTVGAWRSQSVESSNGKILRLDPATGDGLSSNPYYDGGNPRSPQSRLYALGVRNAFSMAKIPNTGSHNIADGDPGIFLIGEVGHNTWEELNILRTGGTNFGWPAYEGIEYNRNFPNEDNRYAPTPSACFKPYYSYRELLSIDGSWPDSCNLPMDIDGNNYFRFMYTPPILDWNHTDAVARVPNGYAPDTLGMPGTAVSGSSFSGQCSIAGTFYEGTDFPAKYQGKYFHADFSAQWIRVLDFDPITFDLISVDTFQVAGMGNVTSMTTSPVEGGLYYVDHLANEIRKIVYQPNNLPPQAVIKQNQIYGPEPLTVQFDGSESTDPDKDAILYDWDFADGSPTNTSTLIKPIHTFDPANGQPTAYYVTLVVTDDDLESDTTTRIISVNNTPPEILSTSIDNVLTYPMSIPTSYPLSAVVSDLEHSGNQLSYFWQNALYHDTHNHPEPEEISTSSVLNISPAGCDTVLYFYRSTLIVEDAAGLRDTVSQDIYPDCGGPEVRTDHLLFMPSQNTTLNVLANDVTNGPPFNLNTLTIITPPQKGMASVIPGTGQILYTPSAGNEPDRLTYMISNQPGNPSAVALVTLNPDVQTSFPIEWLSVQALPLEKSVVVKWDVAGEKVGQYLIERKTNEQGDFASIGSLNASGTRSYHFNDPQPRIGTNYYRIRYQGIDGESSYSQIVKTRIDPNQSQLIVRPNPIPHGQAVVIGLEGVVPDSHYSLWIYNLNGDVLFSQIHTTTIEELTVPSQNWAAGMYMILYQDNNGTKVGKLLIR